MHSSMNILQDLHNTKTRLNLNDHLAIAMAEIYTNVLLD